jgi:NAD-specific glutamate dehydrogenase
MSADTAKRLLIHYFQVSSGKSFDSDCRSEIESIVDCILEAVEENKPENRITKLEQEVKDWERRHQSSIELMRDVLKNLAEGKTEEAESLLSEYLYS